MLYAIPKYCLEKSLILDLNGNEIGIRRLRVRGWALKRVLDLGS